MTWWEIMLLVAGVLGALEGAGIARRWVVGRWRSGPGRRREAEQVLGRLGVGCHISYFDMLLGPPPFRHVVDDTVERVWVDDLFYVHAICTDDDVVVQWLATTRSGSFKPTFKVEPHGDNPTPIRLLTTPFSTAGDPADGTVTAQVGARRSGYWETHYRGNPGHYCTFILGWNDAGAGIGAPLFADLASTDVSYKITQDAVAEFRQTTTPNSFGIALHHVIARDWIGVDADLVRLFP